MRVERELVSTPVNMFSSTLPNQFIDREGEAGEAPAEPLRRQLGRSLALPLFFNRLTWQRCLQGVIPHRILARANLICPAWQRNTRCGFELVSVQPGLSVCRWSASHLCGG